MRVPQPPQTSWPKGHQSISIMEKIVFFNKCFSNIYFEIFSTSPVTFRLGLSTRGPGAWRSWVISELFLGLFSSEDLSDFVPGICWSHSPSLGITAPSALITSGTTDTCPNHILSSSSWAPCVPSSWCCYNLKHINHYLSGLSTTTLFSWLATTISGSHRLVVLNPLWRCWPHWSWDLQPILSMCLYTLTTTRLWLNVPCLPISYMPL